MRAEEGESGPTDTRHTGMMIAEGRRMGGAGLREVTRDKGDVDAREWDTRLQR